MKDFVRANTALATTALVPEIMLHLATDITPIWHATEAWLERSNVAPPYWAFAWPGSQAIARHILDFPHLAAGRRVLDFASGCGLAAIACALAGAASVDAIDIDPMAAAAACLNADVNDVRIAAMTRDVVGEPGRWDLILCGDVCYEAPMTRHIMPWLSSLARDAEVWLADPSRAYVPADGMDLIATYEVKTSMELEDATVRQTRLLRLLGN